MKYDAFIQNLVKAIATGIAQANRVEPVPIVNVEENGSGDCRIGELLQARPPLFDEAWENRLAIGSTNWGQLLKSLDV